jgi:hypothetical protein
MPYFGFARGFKGFSQSPSLLGLKMIGEAAPLYKKVPEDFPPALSLSFISPSA